MLLGGEALLQSMELRRSADFRLRLSRPFRHRISTPTSLYQNPATIREKEKIRSPVKFNDDELTAADPW